MGDTILILSIATVFGGTACLTAFTVAARLWYGRRRREMERLRPLCRATVDALVFEGKRPPQTTGRERQVLLDTLLHYLQVLRGKDAETIVGYLEEARFVDELVGRLHSRRKWERATAADLLGRSRSSHAVPALAEALADPDEDVRIVAARSLAWIGDAEAIAALADALSAPSRWTVALLADDLAALGPGVVSPLLTMTERPERRVVVTAVRVLGEVRDARAADRLVELLAAEDVDVRAQAACALGKIGGPGAARALRDALRDPAWEVRAQAAKALGLMGDADSVRALSEAIVDESWWVRVNCEIGRAHV